MVEGGDDDPSLFGGGVDELPVAEIDANMGDGDVAGFVGEKEEKISFFQGIF